MRNWNSRHFLHERFLVVNDWDSSDMSNTKARAGGRNTPGYEWKKQVPLGGLLLFGTTFLRLFRTVNWLGKKPGVKSHLSTRKVQGTGSALPSFPHILKVASQINKMYRPWKVRGAYFNHSSKQLHRFPYVEKAHFCVSLSQEHRDLEWKCPIWSFKLTWKVTKWKTGSPVGLFPWCQLEISLQRGPHPSFRTDGKLSPSYQTSLISVPSEEGVHLNLTSRPETLCALWEWKKNKRHANRKKKKHHRKFEITNKCVTY